MRTAATIVVGALVATPAQAEPRVRASLELSITPGASAPIGVGVAGSLANPLLSDIGPLLGGAGARFDAFPGRGGGVQLVVEPLIGLGLMSDGSSCSFSPRFLADIRPGLALRSRGGLAFSIATSAEVGEVYGGRLRLGAALPLGANPARAARTESGSFQDVTLSLGATMVNGGCVVGRPLREDGTMLLPDAEGPVGRAAAWLHQAREEHAAVAAFLRLAAELAAVGAPPELVHACRVAAGDEARHARQCLQRAADHGREVVELGPLVTRPRTFARRAEALEVLARESWEDGVLNEGRAALQAWDDACRADDPVDREVHLTIAREEAGHAALGARVVGWCVAA